MTHWSKDKKASTQTRELMSQAKKGVNHPRFKDRYVTPAGVFISSVEAAIANNVSRATVVNKCNRSTDGKPGCHKHCTGWYYEGKYNPALSWHNPPVFEPVVKTPLVRPKGPDSYGVSYARTLNSRPDGA